MKGKTILVVDDDKNICELLNLYLANDEFSVFFCHDGSSALDLLKEQTVDLILLDIMLPVINGWEVCKIIRRKNSVPIIMLTARDMLEDKIQGFDLGADDYIVKPFEPKEVVARIKARLKDKKADVSVSQEGIIKLENILVDINKYEVWQGDRLIDLKPKEVQLLYFLLNNKNLVFSREQLLDKVWNYDVMVDTRTVDVHIKRLRQKLGEQNSWSIKTLRGIGYKLEVR